MVAGIATDQNSKNAGSAREVNPDYNNHAHFSQRSAFLGSGSV
jgi:hypothetical protein